MHIDKQWVCPIKDLSISTSKLHVGKTINLLINNAWLLYALPARIFFITTVHHYIAMTDAMHSRHICWWLGYNRRLTNCKLIVGCCWFVIYNGKWKLRIGFNRYPIITLAIGTQETGHNFREYSQSTAYAHLGTLALCRNTKLYRQSYICRMQIQWCKSNLKPNVRGIY